MNAHIVLGLFALSVAAISLFQVLAGREDALLALLRRFWGRPLGHSLYFVANVALPMLICVLCLGWGVRQFDVTTTVQSLERPLRLNVESYRDLKLIIERRQTPDSLVIVYGA
jgi:hypothetical protein